MLDALQREGLGSHHSAFGSMRGVSGPFGPVKEGLNGVNRRKTAKNLVDSRKN